MHLFDMIIGGQWFFSYKLCMGVVIKKTNDTENACLSFSGFLYIIYILCIYIHII